MGPLLSSGSFLPLALPISSIRLGKVGSMVVHQIQLHRIFFTLWDLQTEGGSYRTSRTSVPTALTECVYYIVPGCTRVCTIGMRFVLGQIDTAVAESRKSATWIEVALDPRVSGVGVGINRPQGGPVHSPRDFYFLLAAVIVVNHGFTVVDQGFTEPQEQ